MFTYMQNRCPFVLFVVFWCAVTMLTLEDKIFIVEQHGLSNFVTEVIVWWELLVFMKSLAFHVNFVFSTGSGTLNDSKSM